MIFVGNQRGHGANLARHLLKDENDHVEVHSLRGFCGETLSEAFQEIEAISRATRCRQYLYSLSLNPPDNEPVSTAIFEEAIERAEKRLGLLGQPRAIVFHEKEGRRHAHVVWSRIDPVFLRAVELPFTKRKLQGLARELYLENDWEMPPGFLNPAERDPNRLSLEEWQQAKRLNKDPRVVKALFRRAWETSDSWGTLERALLERGYALAEGTRRGVVAVDLNGKPFALARWCGVKAKDVRVRLGDRPSLPTIAQARATLAAHIEPTLSHIRKELVQQVHAAREVFASEKQQLRKRQKAARTKLQTLHEQRRVHELSQRQARFRKGLWGIWDRLSGRHRQTVQQNEKEALRACERDQTEQDALIRTHLSERRSLKQRVAHRRLHLREQAKFLSRELSSLQDLREALKEETHHRRQRRDARDPPARSR